MFKKYRTLVKIKKLNDKGITAEYPVIKQNYKRFPDEKYLHDLNYQKIINLESHLTKKGNSPYHLVYYSLNEKSYQYIENTQRFFFLGALSFIAILVTILIPIIFK